MGDRFADWVLRFPKLLLVGGLLLTLATGAGMLKIVFDSDLKNTIPADSQVRIALDDLEDLFGSSETIVMMIEHPEHDAFSEPALLDLMRFTRKLQRTQGVHRVQSLATADRIFRNDEGSLQVEKILPRPPRSPEAVAEIRHHTEDDIDIRQAFVSRDARSLAIYIDPRTNIDDGPLLANLQEAATEVIPDYQVYMTGMAPVRHETDITIARDLVTLVPAVAVVLTIILALALRLVSGVLFTLGLITLSIVPAAGVMGMLGIPMSAQTNTFPIMVLAIACGDSIHILSTYYGKLRNGMPHLDAVWATVRELALPVLLTSVTTAIGFLSLLTSPIPPMGGLGLIVAVGIMWAWLLSTFVLPALLVLLPAPVPPKPGRLNLDGIFERMIDATTRHRLATLLFVAVSVGLVAGVGIPAIEREVAPEAMFPADDPVRISAEQIDKAFQSSSPVEILIRPPAGSGLDVQDPVVIQAVDRFAESLRERVPEIGSVDSLAAIVRRINDMLTGEDRVPDDRLQVTQALFFYSTSGSPDRMQRLKATDDTAMRVTVRLPDMPIERLEKVIQIIEQTSAETLGDLEVIYTGKAMMSLELSQLVAKSSFYTIMFSLLMVFLICSVTFRHVIDGLEGMIPLAVAIVGIFGFMGLVGIPLTIATAIISSIIIGTGVDYGIHVLSRWNWVRQNKELTDHRARVHEMIHEVGRPILFNAFAVACGLAVLGLSNFEAIRQLGILAVISMFTAAFGALILIPTFKSIRVKGV